MNKRAIIYARVSTDEQRGNYSIPSQVRECLQYIERKGYTLVGNLFVDPETGQDATDGIPAFVDDFSSREINRPGLDAAYEYLKTYGYDVCVVLSLDRLDRDPYKLRTHEYGFLREGNAEVEYVKGDYAKTPEGDFLKTVVAGAAKLENDWRTDRFNRGKMQKARRGLFVCGRVPYGYALDSDSLGGLAIVEEDAETVKWIYDAYVNGGLSIYGIKNALDNTQARPSLGGTWGKTTIHRILSNPTYNGTAYYNKHERNEKRTIIRDPAEWITFSVPAIVDISTWTQAQELLKQSRDFRRKQPKRFYMLSGHLFCGNCGKPYTLNPGTYRRVNGTTRDAKRYRHMAKGGPCGSSQVLAELLDPAVWGAVETLLLDPENLKAGYTKAIEKERQANARLFELRDVIYKDNQKLLKMIENLTRAYTDPDVIMPKSEFLEHRARLTSEQKNAVARLREVDAQLSNIPTIDEYAHLEKFAEEIKLRITNPDWQPTPENKKRILDLLHIRVMLDVDQNGGRITGWFGNPLAFSYTSSS